MDEVVPKQRRSRARQAAMIEAGEKLLMDRDIEEISVAEITGSLDYSTGSFYSGFADKTAFFVAVQRSVNAKLQARVEKTATPERIAGLTLVERLERTVDLTLKYFRERRGVIASALRHEASLPDAWAPHRTSAQMIADRMSAGLTPKQAKRLKVAIQMAFGTMVNALLHDPGPLRLNDRRFGAEVKAVLRPYLEVAAPKAR